MRRARHRVALGGLGAEIERLAEEGFAEKRFELSAGEGLGQTVGLTQQGNRVAGRLAAETEPHEVGRQ